MVLVVLFFIGLIYYLDFEPLFARRGFVDEFMIDLVKANYIPFKTIIEYLKAMFNIPYSVAMSYDTDALFLNLIGNLFCFSPLAILFPLCFDKMKKSKNFLLISLIICICFEIAQCISMNGAFDIDDIILNYSGIILVYFLVRKDFISFIEKVILNDNKEFSYEKVILVFGLVLLTFISLFSAFKYRDKMELNYISYTSGFDIEYRYTGDYIEDYKEVIFEDDMIIVYLNHYRAEYVIIKIYDEEMPLSKWLNGETVFYLNIYKLRDTDMDIEIVEKEIRKPS